MAIFGSSWKEDKCNCSCNNDYINGPIDEDLKALKITKPRGKSRLIAQVTVRDFWKLYHKENRKTPLDISYKGYKDVIDANNIIAKNTCLKKGIIKMNNMGHLIIRKNKRNLMNSKGKIIVNVDWKNSKKYGKIVYNLNPHSNEQVYRIKWNAYTTPIINKSWYDFK